MSRSLSFSPRALCSLIVNEDAAHAVVSSLGKTGGIVQFLDLNPEATPFQRKFVSYVKRCDELERKLRYFHGQVQEMGLEVQSAGSVDQFLNSSVFGGTSGRKETAKSGSFLLETLEAELEGYEKQLVELSGMSKKLTQEYNEKLEYQEVLAKSRSLYRDEGSNLIRETEAKGAEAEGTQVRAASPGAQAWVVREQCSRRALRHPPHPTPLAKSLGPPAPLGCSC